MKTKLLSLFVFIASQIFSQNWCPGGAQWYYQWISLADDGFVHYQYTSDTVVVSKPCRQIESVRYTRNHIGPPGYYLFDTVQGKTIYTYSTNDTVFFYYENFNRWLPTYFFSAQVGDTLTIPNYNHHFSTSDTVFSRAVVDSVGSATVDAQQVRLYTFHILDTINWCEFPGTVVEKLGMLDNDIMPFWHCVTDDYYYSFCSYQDNATALYPLYAFCRFVLTDVQQIRHSQSEIRIAPNPATTHLTLQLQQTLAAQTVFTLFDITGRMVLQQPLTSQTNTIDVSAVSKGMYLYNVVSEKQKAGAGKVVVE